MQPIIAFFLSFYELKLQSHWILEFPHPFTTVRSNQNDISFAVGHSERKGRKSETSHSFVWLRYKEWILFHFLICFMWIVSFPSLRANYIFTPIL